MTRSPFEGLGELPVDVAEALDQFKLAVIRHRAMGFEMISQEKLASVFYRLGAFTLDDDTENAYSIAAAIDRHRRCKFDDIPVDSSLPPHSMVASYNPFTDEFSNTRRSAE